MGKGWSLQATTKCLREAKKARFEVIVAEQGSSTDFMEEAIMAKGAKGVRGGKGGDTGTALITPEGQGSHG